MYEFKKDMLVYLIDRSGRIQYEGKIIVTDGPIKDFPIVVDFKDLFRDRINRFRFDFSGIPHESNDVDFRLAIPKLNKEINLTECGFKTNPMEYPIVLTQLLDVDALDYFKLDGLMNPNLVYYRIYLSHNHYINVIGEHANIWEVKHLVNKLIDGRIASTYNLDERIKEIQKSEIDVKDRTLRGPLSSLLKVKEPINFWADIDNNFFFWIDKDTIDKDIGMITKRILKLLKNSLT